MTDAEFLRQASAQAKADQLAKMAAAKSAMAAYWAGSITSSVAHHAQGGAVRQVNA